MSWRGERGKRRVLAGLWVQPGSSEDERYLVHGPVGREGVGFPPWLGLTKERWMGKSG